MVENFHVERVSGPDLMMVWPQLAGDMQRHPDAWDQSETLESVYGQLISGHMQLWVLLDKAGLVQMHAITTASKTPAGMVMRVAWALGRDPKVCVEAIDALEAVARLNGCVRFEICGRRGWEKLFRPLGYEFVSVTVAKDLARPREVN